MEWPFENPLASQAKDEACMALNLALLDRSGKDGFIDRNAAEEPRELGCLLSDLVVV